MASSSSSAQLSAHVHYDVFITHRGPDVKKTLASHFYVYLERCAVRAFLDTNEMRASGLIDAQIEHAITNAPVYIAIFSQNYAQSPWCLNELTSMMKFPERILPVFYDVEPWHLRRLDRGGPYAEALKILEEKRDGEKPRYDSETLQKWRKALSDVPLRSGYERKKFNRKSTASYIFSFGSSPIIWQTKKMNTLALSTTEAEYRALVEAGKEALWIKSFMAEIGFPLQQSIVLNIDNQGAISIAINPVGHSRTKHVELHLHFIRNHVHDGTFQLVYCPSEKQVADILTKSLTNVKFCILRDLLGMAEVIIKGEFG